MALLEACPIACKLMVAVLLRQCGGNALIHNRSILLVDEGTSALDQKNADIVEKSLLANPDLTLILVSHHLTEARKGQFSEVYELEPPAASYAS